MADFERQKVTTLTLANAAQLAVNVVNNVAGNDVSNSLNGAKVTSALIATMISQRIIKNLKLSQ